MSQNLPPPIPLLVPETAPFSEEQRAWLNGFFAGLVSLDGQGVTALSADQAAALLAGGPAPAAEDDDGGAPWHDQSLPIGERMQLAEGKPLRWKLMAAMAQQDCGQCGYDCHNYSGAIFDGKETRLNLCAPGGKDTARMVKTLAEQIGTAPTLDSAPSLAADAAPIAALPPRGTSRDNPATAKVLSRRRLNKPGSEKETWHVEFELEDCLSYEAGDSFGLFPTNDPALVDAVLHALGAPADPDVVERLRPHYGDDGAVAVVVRASWPEQQVIRGTLGSIAAQVAAEGIDRTALILVGPSLAATDFRESSLYAPDYDRRYRRSAEDGRDRD